MPKWFALILILSSLTGGGLASYFTDWGLFTRVGTSDPDNLWSASTVGAVGAYVAVLLSLYLALRRWAKELDDDAARDGLLFIETLGRRVMPLAVPMVALGASAGGFLRVTGFAGLWPLALAAAPFIMLALVMVCTLPLPGVRAWAAKDSPTHST